jgi:hypothetical protein
VLVLVAVQKEHSQRFLNSRVRSPLGRTSTELGSSSGIVVFSKASNPALKHHSQYHILAKSSFQPILNRSEKSFSRPHNLIQWVMGLACFSKDSDSDPNPIFLGGHDFKRKYDVWRVHI